MLDSTHEENIMKTRKTITPIVNTKKLCVCQNIPLSDHRDSTKNHLEVGKVILPIQKILQNYNSIESRNLTKTLKTSFKTLHDILFQLRFFNLLLLLFLLLLFCGNSRQTVILVSYSFFYVLQHGW